MVSTLSGGDYVPVIPFEGASIVGRTKKQRKKQRKHPDSSLVTKTFERDLRDRFPEYSLEVKRGSTGLPKLSERIIELAQPLLEDAESKKEEAISIDLSAMAWNLSLDVGKKREELLSTILKTLAPFSPFRKKALRKEFENLVRRKERLFPHDRRYIASWEVTPRPGSILVNVASLREG